MVTVHIVGHVSNRIEIVVRGYERPDAEDFHDANWLTAAVALVVYPFTAEYGVSIETHAFQRFATELNQLVESVSGKASFECMEEWLSLEVTVSRTGAAIVRGNARDRSNTLKFEFETDQTFLAETSRELKALLRQFPVKLAT